MDLQRLSIKLFAEPNSDVKQPEFVPIFHSWIQKQKIKDHLLIDVADYKHVPEGPGIMLVAHEGNFATDESEGEPGLLYQRKRFLEGSLAERLKTVLKAALQAVELLEQEPYLKERIRFDRNHFQVISNDRLNLPNTEQSHEFMHSSLSEAAKGFFCHEQFTLTRRESDKDRYSVSVKSSIPS